MVRPDEILFVMIRAKEAWQGDTYPYFCPSCLTQFTEKLDRCPFCGSRGLRKNDLVEYVKAHLRVSFGR